VKRGRRGEVQEEQKKPSFILIQYIVAHESAAFVDEETSSSSILHPCMLQSPTHRPVVTRLGPQNIHHERGWIDGDFCSSTKVASYLWVYHQSIRIKDGFSWM
jgi:hypothetical protein